MIEQDMQLREKYLNIEAKIFQIYFKPEDFESKDVKINDRDFLHVTEIKKIEKTKSNVLIALHGFGGFGGVFARLVSKLADKFYIILVDLPEMGFSSRQKKELFNNFETCLDFFLTRLRAFLNILKIHQFSLLGHSLGGFLATHLYNLEHKRIIKLYLLSPAGFHNYLSSDFKQKKNNVLKNLNCLKAFFFNLFHKYLFYSKKSPFEFWTPLWFKEKITERFWKRSRFQMNKKEAQNFIDINKYFLKLPHYGERCLPYLIYFLIGSQSPILEILKKLNQFNHKVLILYGDHDLLDGYTSDNLIQSLNLNVKVFFIESCEHQLIFQNITDISKRIVNGNNKIFPEENVLEEEKDIIFF